jgi:predicted  nucleic acid-binding Zn-ribbon protein
MIVSSRTMKLRETNECPNCKPIARRLAKLEQQLAAALERIDKLEEENAQLKQQLAAARKNSSTSSKPPSSDIVKPKKPPGKGREEAKTGRAAGT